MIMRLFSRESGLLVVFCLMVVLSNVQYASGAAFNQNLSENLGLADTVTKATRQSLSENLGMADTITISTTTPTTTPPATSSGSGSSGKSFAPSFIQPTIGSGQNTLPEGLTLTFNSQKFSINESGRLEQQQEATTKNSEKTTLFSTSTGEQVKLKFKVYAPLGINDIRHVEFHTNQKGAQVTGLAKSDTAIIYDKYKKLEVLGDEIFSSTNISLSDAGGGFVEITIDMTFAKPIGTSDIVIRLWNEARYDLRLYVADSINVEEKTKGPENTPPSQKQELIESKLVQPLEKPQDAKEDKVSQSNSVLDTSTIEKWAGFSPESVSDKQLLDMLDIESKTETIPDWLKNLGRFVHEKGITPHEVENALRYMAKHGYLDY